MQLLFRGFWWICILAFIFMRMVVYIFSEDALNVQRAHGFDATVTLVEKGLPRVLAPGEKLDVRVDVVNIVRSSGWAGRGKNYVALGAFYNKPIDRFTGCAGHGNEPQYRTVVEQDSQTGLHKLTVSIVAPEKPAGIFSFCQVADCFIKN